MMNHSFSFDPQGLGKKWPDVTRDLNCGSRKDGTHSSPCKVLFVNKTKSQPALGVRMSYWGRQTMSKANTYVTCHMVVGAMKIK